jgi:hypothetical protein
MSSLRQLGNGFLYALVSVVLVVGGLSLALAEGGFKSTTSTPSPNPSSTVVFPSASPVGSSTANATSTVAISSPTAGPSATSQAVVLTATPVPPSATTYYASAFPTATTYYYPYPTATHSAYHTTVPCGPYAGWVLSYTVQPGDTLYHIATQYRTSVNAVQIANCKPTTVIFPGERLWVPNVPTITPGVTFVPTFPSSTPVPTEPLTLTPLPTFTDTAVPTDTLVPNP